MKLTVAQLKIIIRESLEWLPPRQQVEMRLQDAKFDKNVGAKLLSLLDRSLPANKKLLLQQLSRALLLWQNDKANWNAVTQVLDKIYAGPRRRSSYTSLPAVMPSNRPMAI